MNTSIAFKTKNPLAGAAADSIITAMAKGNGEKKSVQGWLKGNDVSSGGGAQLTNAYQQSVWVYACVNAIADQVAQIPFRFSTGERGGENILTRGPVLDLYAQPHPQLDAFQYWELKAKWLGLRGEFFCVPVSEGRGITKLVIPSPDSFQEIVENHELKGWRYTGYGNQAPLETQVLLPEEVYFYRFINPYNFWRGLSPLVVAHLAAQTDYASAQFQKGLMTNNADTGVIIRTDQQLDEPQREALLAALRERKNKAGTADRPLLLWGGAEVVKPTLSSTDMQFLENRKYNRQEICAVYGTPQEVLGFTEDANRSVADAARLNWIENKICPLLRRLEASEDKTVKRFGKNIYGWFDEYSLPIMQKARRERFAGAKDAMTMMGVPLNTCNQVFDLGLPNDLPHGEKVFLPFSLQEYGEAPANTPADVTVDPPKENAFEGLAKLLRSTVIDVVPTRTALPPIVRTSSEEYAASIEGSVRNKKGKLSKFFFQQRSRVLAKLDALTKDLVGDSQSSSLRKSIDDVFDPAFENAELLKKLKPLLYSDLEFGGQQMFTELGLGDFAVPPSEAIAYLEKRISKIEDINRTTFESLKSTLGDGLAAGETQDQLADRVKALFSDASEGRAQVIALTETNTAINSGRMEGLTQSGVEAKGWLSSHLDNTRPAHVQAEQDYLNGIPIDEPFIVGGEALDHPCDPNGSPANVINCRCVLLARQAGKSVIPKSFLRWESFLQSKQAKEGGARA